MTAQCGGCRGGPTGAGGGEGLGQGRAPAGEPVQAKGGVARPGEQVTRLRVAATAAALGLSPSGCHGWVLEAVTAHGQTEATPRRALAPADGVRGPPWAPLHTLSHCRPWRRSESPGPSQGSCRGWATPQLVPGGQTAPSTTASLTPSRRPRRVLLPPGRAGQPELTASSPRPHSAAPVEGQASGAPHSRALFPELLAPGVIPSCPPWTVQRLHPSPSGPSAPDSPQPIEGGCSGHCHRDQPTSSAPEGTAPALPRPHVRSRGLHPPQSDLSVAPRAPGVASPFSHEALGL